MEDRRRLLCRATLPDGTVDRIEGFATEGDAGRWARNESAAWLHSRQKKIAGRPVFQGI